MHSNDNSVSIYAQSATDLSDNEEEQGQQQASRSTPRGLLEVPSSNSGIKKSSSSNLVVDQEKKDTVMAFFGGTRWAPVGIYRMTIVVMAYILLALFFEFPNLNHYRVASAQFATAN